MPETRALYDAIIADSPPAGEKSSLFRRPEPSPPSGRPADRRSAAAGTTRPALGRGWHAASSRRARRCTTRRGVAPGSSALPFTGRAVELETLRALSARTSSSSSKASRVSARPVSSKNLSRGRLRPRYAMPGNLHSSCGALRTSWNRGFHTSPSSKPCADCSPRPLAGRAREPRPGSRVAGRSSPPHP